MTAECRWPRCRPKQARVQVVLQWLQGRGFLQGAYFRKSFLEWVLMLLMLKLLSK